MRSAAGTDAASNYILVKGAVVQVAEGPTVVDDLNWYRVASLGGAVGWVTSGWVAEPFLTTLVEDPTLIRCGEVEARGVRRRERRADAARPNCHRRAGPARGRLQRSSRLAAMELIRGVGGEACFSAQVGSDGVPVVSAAARRQRLRPRRGGRELLPASPGGGPGRRGRGAGEGPGHRAPDGPGGRTARRSEVVQPPNRRHA